MTIQQRKSHLEEVGKFLRQFSPEGIQKDTSVMENDPYFHQLMEQTNLAIHNNGWFTKENVLFAIQEWGKTLTGENLSRWVEGYDLNEEKLKTVGIVMAGNLPLVGFHDFLSVLISGNKVLAKLSSNDKKLLPIIAGYLIAIEPEYKNRISFTEGRMENFEAVIATGSNNTARYFEYYFANKPSIIRKNRNSVAVISGKETREELAALGNDIFRYFGLGCRNVSKLYVPEGYDFDSFYKALAPYVKLLDHAKYANNYDYNKAVYLMSDFKFLDNGFLMLKEDVNFSSPIATLFYEVYSNKESLEKKLITQKDQLQCVVSREFMEQEIPFGKSQHPSLQDYADNVDTLAFLQQL